MTPHPLRSVDLANAAEKGVNLDWHVRDGKAILIPFTGIALPSLLPENERLANTLEDLHGTIGEVFYWVIGAHVLAALWHHMGRRDDTLRRML